MRKTGVKSENNSQIIAKKKQNKLQFKSSTGTWKWWKTDALKFVLSHNFLRKTEIKSENNSQILCRKSKIYSNKSHNQAHKSDEK